MRRFQRIQRILLVFLLLLGMLPISPTRATAAVGSINDPELGYLYENFSCGQQGCVRDATIVAVDGDSKKTPTGARWWYNHGWKLYVKYPHETNYRYVGDLLGLADGTVTTMPVVNYIPISNITWWVSQLNGNPAYVETKVPKHRLEANGRTSWRAHIRDVVRESGGSVPSWDNTTRSVYAIITKKPDGVIPDLPPQRQGDTARWNIGLYAYSAERPGIDSYRLTVNGVEIASGGKIPHNSYTFQASYTWPAAGKYTLTLTVTDQVQRTTVITKTIDVAALPGNPVADFDLPPTGEVNKPVQVVNRSKAAQGATLTKHEWTVSPTTYQGSLGSSGGTLTFKQPGTYTVTLKVTDNFGKTGTATKQITVSTTPRPAKPGPPTAAFDLPPTAQVGEEVQVVNKSTAASGATLVKHEWTVSPTTYQGSLGNSGGTLTFTQPGTYTVTLKVTDNYGQTGTATKQITVSSAPPPQPQGPTAKFSMLAKGKVGVPVQIKNYSKAAPGHRIVSNTWVVYPTTYTGTLTDEGGTLTFTQPGTYRVTLWVVDDQGLSDTTSKQITVEAVPPPPEPPVAGISAPATAVQGETVTITSTSTDPDSEIVSYKWQVTPAGMVGSLTGEGGTVYFDEPGTYTIRLTVTDSQGLSDTAQTTIQVTPAVPQARFVVSGWPKQFRELTFDGSSSRSPGRYPLDWSKTKWEFLPPAGVPASAAQIVDASTPQVRKVRFTVPGDWKVRLTVYNTKGTPSAPYEQTIRVEPDAPPVAVIDMPATAIQGEDVPIRSASYDPDGQIASYSWQVTPAGMVGSLTGEGGTVYFDEPGTYTVKLTVTDEYGQQATTQATIQIEPDIPIAYFMYTGWPKVNRKLVFDASASAGSERYPIDWAKTRWEFIPPPGVSPTEARVVTDPDLRIRQLLFKQPGQWRVRLTVYNSKGTPSEPYEQVLQIYPDEPPVADFYTVNVLTRDPEDQNYATIRLVDRSYSPDNDHIAQRRWEYRFDSDNDGSFADETWILLDAGNNPNPQLRTRNVGRFEFRLTVTEAFGQETIPEFLTEADVRKSNTDTKPLADRTVEVQNLAPIVAFDVIKKPKADLAFIIGQLNNRSAKRSTFQNALTPLRQSLTAAGIDTQIIQTDAVGNLDTVTQQDSQYLYFYIGGTVEPKYVIRINKSGNNTGGMVIFRRDRATGNLVEVLNLGQYDIDLRHSDGDHISGHSFSIGSTFASGNVIETRFSCSHMTITRTVTVAPDGTITISYSGTSPYYSYQEFRFSDGIVSLVSGQRTVQQNGNGIFRTWGPAGGSYSYQFAPNIAPSLAEVAAIYTDAAVQFRPDARPYLIYVGDNPFEDFSDPVSLARIQREIISRGGRIIGLGSPTNRTQFETLISQTGAGVFILNSENMAGPMATLTDWLLADLSTVHGTRQQYVLLGEEVIYQTYYEDTEQDPQYAQRWIYQHDPTVYKNSQGLASFAGQYLPQPVTRFDKVGRYEVQFQVRDNPVGTDDRFDAYRLWSSMPLDKLVLWVHRKPEARFVAQLQPKPGGGYTLTSLYSTSYDLDHLGEPGNGIVAEEWRWKTAAATTWTEGKPTNLAAGEIYLVALRVQDLEGAWSDWHVQALSTASGNMPPVAQFTVSPNPLPLSRPATYTDTSYDPNGHPITQRRWRVAKLPSGSWVDYGSNPPTNFSTLGVGEYRIELTVRDELGAWSDPYYQTLTVVPDNRKPVAQFTVSPNPLPADVQPVYNDTSYDPDGDPIVAREWQYRKNGGPWQPGRPDDFSALGPGTYDIRLRVLDQPALSQMTPLWSDWYQRTLTVVAGNQKPVARFTVSPNPVSADEPVTYTDQSYDPEGLPLVERVWRVTTEDGQVLADYINQLPPRVFANTGWGNGGVGTYRIGLRVRDQSPNGLSPSQWSDWYWQTLTVVLPLSGDATVTPNPAPSGRRISITVTTAGYADQVQVLFPDDRWFHGDVLNLEPESAPASKFNTWTGSYVTDVYTPDGPYTLRVIVRRTSMAPQTIEIPVVLQIQGSIYDRLKPRIRSHGLPGDMYP